MNCVTPPGTELIDKEFMQGYLFSRPMTADKVLPYVQQVALEPKTLEVRHPEA